MNIDWATLCNSADIESGALNIQSANMEFALAPTLPVQIGCSVAIKLGGIVDAPAIEQITVRILSPTGDLIYQYSQDVTVELPPGIAIPTGVSVHHPMVARLGWAAETYGTYSVVVESGDGSSYEVRLTVVSGF